MAVLLTLLQMSSRVQHAETQRTIKVVLLVAAKASLSPDEGLEVLQLVKEQFHIYAGNFVCRTRRNISSHSLCCSTPCYFSAVFADVD